MNVDLNRIHNEVIQEKRFGIMLKGEISRLRESLDASIRQTISSLRNFGLLDIWYPRLSEAVVTSFLASTIFTREKRQVFDSPSVLNLPTNKTLKINQFLKGYHVHIPLMVKCVDEYFSENREYPSYIPCESPNQFFASSTFLSLFGYCWCVEQGAAYVEALCQLMTYQIKRCTTVTSESFRNSFIRNIVRQFIHVTGVQKYLQLSLTSVFFDFVYDETLSSYSSESKEYFDRLIWHVGKFTERMIQYLPFMPSLLRYFFKKAYQTAQTIFGPDSNEPQMLIEVFFFDLLLQPALTNPKLFALFPETSVVPRTSHITLMTKFFRWSISESSIPEKYSSFGFAATPAFKALQVLKLVRMICEYNGEVEGVFSSKLQQVSDMRYHLLLLSVVDVHFIANIINQTIDVVEADSSEKEKLKQLTSFEINSSPSSDELIDFWFQAYKLPVQPFSPPNLKTTPKLYLPILPTQIPPLPNDNLTSIVNHMITYLESLTPSKSAPSQLIEFLNYQEAKALENSSIEYVSKTHSVLAKIRTCGFKEGDILTRLQLTIQKRLEQHSSELASSFEHQECCTVMDLMKRKVKLMNEQLTPILHQSLLRLFLLKNKQIDQIVREKEQIFISNKSEWIKFFVQCANDIVKSSFMNSLDNSHKLPIMRQLHSSVVTMMPYGSFISSYPGIKGTKEFSESSYQALHTKFMKDDYSPVLVQLFKAPSCFESAISVLKRGTSIGAPLERLQGVQESMNVLQDIYSFEAGEGCPGDDFLPLFIYCLIMAKLPNLLPILEYIKHFLLSAEEEVKLLESKEKYVATTFVTAADHIIAELSKH